MELKPGDYIMEYRQVDANGDEEIKAKYYVAKDGKYVSLVPVTAFFGNHDLLDNLQYWIDQIDSGGIKSFDRDATQRYLSGDLQILKFVLANLTPERAVSERLAWENKAKSS